MRLDSHEIGRMFTIGVSEHIFHVISDIPLTVLRNNKETSLRIQRIICKFFAHFSYNEAACIPHILKSLFRDNLVTNSFKLMFPFVKLTGSIGAQSEHKLENAIGLCSIHVKKTNVELCNDE